MALEEITSCPICGQSQFEEYASATDHTTTGEIFQLKKCKNCHLVVTTPRPDAASIGKYYESPDYISHSAGNTEIFDTAYRLARNRALKHKLKLINTWQHNRGIMLDYGCGTGSFLNTCKLDGWKTIGVEPSATARKHIPSTLQVHPDLNNITGPINAITLWHVLEHVHTLRETLNSLATLLHPTGTIFIAVPNNESHDAQHYGSNWAGYDVPRHLWHFNKSNMKQLLESSGLHLRSIIPMKLDAFYVSLLSERYRKPTATAISRVTNAVINGLRSNLKARSDNYSSLIYVAAK